MHDIALKKFFYTILKTILNKFLEWFKLGMPVVNYRRKDDFEKEKNVEISIFTEELFSFRRLIFEKKKKGKKVERNFFFLL